LLRIAANHCCASALAVAPRCWQLLTRALFSDSNSCPIRSVLAHQRACEYWLMYLETYDEISEVFDKYDDGHTGFLSKDKFAACMEELNGGIPLGV
jgi:hypothetical protein